MSATNQQTSSPASNAMNRYDLTRALVGKLGTQDAIIGGIGNTNFDLWAVERRPLNFYMLGSMGLAIPIALGLAIAQPERRVIALEGDGSVLMQLGVFATVAKLGQKNLGTIIMDNGCYQITGAQPTVTAAGTDIAAISRACGLEHSVLVHSADEFDRTLERFLALEQPWVIVAKIDHSPARETTERLPMRIRDRFMDALNARA